MSGYIDLGFDADPLRVKTPRGSGVITGFAPDPKNPVPFDPDEVWELRFPLSGVVWTAVVTPEFVTWTLTAAQVDAQPNATPVELWVDNMLEAVGEIYQPTRPGI